jgi:hypothetical protein
LKENRTVSIGSNLQSNHSEIPFDALVSQYIRVSGKLQWSCVNWTTATLRRHLNFTSQITAAPASSRRKERVKFTSARCAVDHFPAL